MSLIRRGSATLLGISLVGLAMAGSILSPDPILLVVDARNHSAGDATTGAYQRHSWTIRNVGHRRVKLRTRFTSGRCGFSLWLGEDYFVAAGEALVVSLSCPTPSQASTTFSSVAEVLSDDPRFPRLRFHLYGRTGPDSGQIVSASAPHRRSTRRDASVIEIGFGPGRERNEPDLRKICTVCGCKPGSRSVRFARRRGGGFVERDEGDRWPGSSGSRTVMVVARGVARRWSRTSLWPRPPVRAI